MFEELPDLAAVALDTVGQCVALSILPGGMACCLCSWGSQPVVVMASTLT